jgi:hypothetical protein
LRDKESKAYEENVLTLTDWPALTQVYGVIQYRWYSQSLTVLQLRDDKTEPSRDHPTLTVNTGLPTRSTMVTLSEDRTAAGMAESLEEPRREEEGDNINAVRFRSGSDDIRTQSSLDRQGMATSHDKEGVDDDESDDQGGDTLGPLMGDDDVELGMDRPPSQPASTQSKNERTSHVHDLSSGKAGGARTHQAVVRINVQII